MDEELDMQAMGMMAGPDSASADESGTTTVDVPNFALAAVMELIAMLEEEMAGGGMGPMDDMGGGMPPMDGMGGGMPPMGEDMMF
jgi:hypothetical protein